MNSIIEGIRAYLADCPLLAGGVLHVNFLDERGPSGYTIDEMPGDLIVKRYTDGSTVRQAVFLVASAEDYSRDALENLKACGFYESLADWLESNSRAGILPVLPAGCAALSMETTTHGYCIRTDIQQNVQRYQVQCRLLYFKEAI